MSERTISTSVLQTILKRRSPRSIIGDVPSREQVTALFEATRWAPSAFNEQPWRFLLVSKDDPARFEQALSCLLPGNRAWVQQAPLIVFCISKNFYDRNGKKNETALLDLGLAVENMLLETVNQGLVSHPMSGILPDSVRELFSVPEGFDPILAIAIGKLGSPDLLDEPLKKMELAARNRLPLESVVFDRFWGNGFDPVMDSKRLK